MYDKQGNKIWDCMLDIYGKVIDFTGKSPYDCPFRFQGQYEDAETGLYYNRFRYYSAEIGCYLTHDPIDWLGESFTVMFLTLTPILILPEKAVIGQVKIWRRMA